MEIWFTTGAWVSLATLSALEIVLGIDNIVFITILTGRLPAEQQPRARNLGLGFALLSRLALLFAISWIMGLGRPLFTVLGVAMTGRALILLLGGLFLIAKATFEIHAALEVRGEHGGGARTGATMTGVIIQIMLLDIVFSLDSVITAVGMVEHVSIMMVAMVLAMMVMLVFAGPIGAFITRHPSMKMLALSFLLLVGVLLTAEAFGRHVDKGYVYFAMAFSLLVELLNMRARKKREAPVQLHHHLEAP